MKNAIASSLLTAFVLLSAIGCGPGDPRTEAIQQRSRWSVELVSWIQKQDGNLGVEVRFTGPPSTTLERLTIRISQLDAEGAVISSSWHTIDTKDVPLGAPKELRFNIPPAEGVEGLTAENVLAPTAEDEQNIPELKGL